MKKNKFRKRHPIIFFLATLVILALLIWGGFKTFTYVKFLLGYDLTIRLSADKTDLNLLDGQSGQITFTLERISNVLCTTECGYSFTDLSENIMLSSGNFTAIPAIPRQITEEVSAPSAGEGQKVYALDISCKNKATTLCKTEETPINRRTLVTMEYSLSEQQAGLKEVVKNKLTSSYSRYSSANETFRYISSEILNNEKSFLANKTLADSLRSSLNYFPDAFFESLQYWTAQDYDGFLQSNALENSAAKINDNLNQLNKSIYENIARYNRIIDNLTAIKKSIEITKEYDLNKTQAEELDNIIIIFNSKSSEIANKYNMSDKQAIADYLEGIELSNFINQSTECNSTITKYADGTIECNGTNISYKANENIYFFLEKINLSIEYANYTAEIELPENKKTCCLNNRCQFCEQQATQPILLLHGHNFNADISADNSINIFDNLQKELEDAGYLDAGEFYLYETTRSNPRILGTLARPITVRASYYFDFLKKPQGYESVQIKSENIDTYAIRLKEIIENIKYETGSTRITIIGHSMGGLVVRRYIQIFGNESIEKLILINTPNEGISGRAIQYCDILGSTRECRDMDSNSLFINKLNNEKTATINITNIAGYGCSMDLGDGDGVVLKTNAILNRSYVNNIFIRGSCSGTDLLHNSLLDMKRYPQLFDEVKRAL